MKYLLFILFFFSLQVEAICIFGFKKIIPSAEGESLKEAFNRLQSAKENLSNPNEEYIIKMSKFIKAWQEYERKKKGLAEI